MQEMFIVTLAVDRRLLDIINVLSGIFILRINWTLNKKSKYNAR